MGSVIFPVTRGRSLRCRNAGGGFGADENVVRIARIITARRFHTVEKARNRRADPLAPSPRVWYKRRFRPGPEQAGGRAHRAP